MDAVDARVAALEADASLAELQEDVAAIEATFGIPKVYSVSKSAPTKINIAQAGGDRIVLSGDGFSDDTKVELIEGEQTLKPKAVETNGEGTSLTVTMPKIVPSTSFCNGGDGKDGDVAVAIRVYGTGDASKSFFERKVYISVTDSEFGTGADGDLEVTKEIKWGQGTFGTPYMLKVDDTRGLDGNTATRLKSVHTYTKAETLSCGDKILFQNFGAHKYSGESAGFTTFGIVLKVDGHVVTFKDAIAVDVKNYKAEETKLVISRVPQFNKLTFKGAGYFQAQSLNVLNSGNEKDGYALKTGTIAFLARKIVLAHAANQFAVRAAYTGYAGGVSSGSLAIDAARAQIAGGFKGEDNSGGRGHNRDGRYGGKGCPNGRGGAGGSSGARYGYGGMYRFSGGDSNRPGGGGGGGADWGYEGSGGAGAHCSGSQDSRYDTTKGWMEGAIYFVAGGGAAAGGGGGTGHGSGGLPNGKGGASKHRSGGKGGNGGRGGGIVIVGVNEVERAGTGKFATTKGGRGGCGGGGSAGTHKTGGGGGGQGANGAAGGALFIRDKSGQLVAGLNDFRGGDAGGGGGGSGVANQHDPSRSGGGGAGAGKCGGGGGGTTDSNNGMPGGDGNKPGQGPSGGKVNGGGGGCTGPCNGRGGNANKGGWSSSTSCNRGADASGTSGGNGGNANGCGGDANGAAGGGGGGAGASGEAGYAKLIL